MASLLSSLTAWSSTLYQHVWWAFKFHPIASTTALVLSSLAAIKWMMSTRWSKSTSRLAGTSILITGAGAGIGLATAEECARAGAKSIVILCRTTKAAAEAEKSIVAIGRAKNPNFSLQVVACELGNLESVRQCAQVLVGLGVKYDHLILNAGIFMVPEGKTPDGFEMHLGVNHFGHFLLTHLIRKNNLLNDNARVVAVSSNAPAIWPGFDIKDLDWKSRPYSSTYAYGASKTANILMMQELQRQFDAEGKGRLAFSVHPGFVRTKFSREATGLRQLLIVLFYPLYWAITLSPLQGSQCTLYAATSPDITKIGGAFFNNLRPAPTEADKKPELPGQFWKISEERLGLRQ